MKSAAPIPHWVVNDGVAAIQFHEAAFGAVCNSKRLADDGKRIMHADSTFGSGTIFFWGRKTYNNAISALRAIRVLSRRIKLRERLKAAGLIEHDHLFFTTTSARPPACSNVASAGRPGSFSRAPRRPSRAAPLERRFQR